MSKHIKKSNLIIYILCMIFLISCFSFSPAILSYSDTISDMEAEEKETQAAISNLEKQTAEAKTALSELNSQKQNSEANVKDLKNKSANLNNEYENYSEKLDDLTLEIESTQKAMEETSRKILEINTQKAETEVKRTTLYNQAKDMIKGIYESGGSNTFVKILVSNITSGEFFKKAEYISAVVSYEQKIMNQLRALEEDLKAQALELENQQKQIDSYQDELDAKEDELMDLTNEVLSALNKTNSNISNENAKLKQYDSQINDLKAKMQSLESEVAKAQAKLAQQIEKRLAAMEAQGMRENLTGAYNATDEELVWLAATIQAEAGGEPYVGKLAVGSVILNRVFSSSFPNDIISVITQNMQFASYRSGMVEAYINKGPNSSCMQAAREVLAGSRVGEYLFFMTQKWADYYRIKDYTMIGHHAFFYRWVTYPKEEVAAEEQPAAETQPVEESQPVEETPAAEETPQEEQYSEEQPE